MKTRTQCAAYAKIIASRFVDAATAWLALPDIDRLGASKEGGEMIRESIELSRALSQLRNWSREKP